MKKEDKKSIEDYPKYNGVGEYKGTQEYFSRVFEMEANKDPELHLKFVDLHTKIINEVVNFCKENNLAVDELSISATGLKESIDFGSWHPGTDSCMNLVDESGATVLYSI